jgi:hypothetical protein
LSSLGLRYRDIEALIQLSVRRFGTGWFYPVLCMAVNFSSILVSQTLHYLKGFSDILHVIYLVSIKEHHQLHLDIH